MAYDLTRLATDDGYICRAGTYIEAYCTVCEVRIAVVYPVEMICRRDALGLTIYIIFARIIAGIAARIRHGLTAHNLE